jgi:flavin reductase (DIM6/NTAB) family NADH-FMN oxidoreductase RutF/DNA-binding IclR family transcriptional regulator
MSSTSAAPSLPGVDPARFRETLGHYPTGVTIVTAIDDTGDPTGMVVGSFSSVSLDPPLVAFMPMRYSGTFARLRTSGSFCVNVLAADQEALCRRFATPGRTDRFDGVRWRPAASGAPVLDDVVSWIDCDVESVTEAGDHYIVLGRVRDLGVGRPALPLLFFQGGYGKFSPASLIAPSDPDLIHGVRLAELSRDALESAADDLGAHCAVLAAVGEEAVFVAVADRSPLPSRTFVGSCVPLVPPLGSVFITSSGSVAVRQWLGRLPSADAATHATYVEQLQRVHERGYSLSLADHRSDDDIFTAVRDYSEPGRLPEHERRFKRLITETTGLYEPDLDPDARYDIHSIVVPVVGPLDQVQIALRAANLPRGATGAEVQGWIRRLRDSAAEAAARIPADCHPPE